MKKSGWMMSAACVVTSTITSGPAWAQDAAPVTADNPQADTGLGEIVVTAQRKSENIQNAALAISAASGDELTNNGIASVQQLTAMTPALQISSGTGTYTWFAVRGVSNTGANAFADPAVAVNYDGVYLSTPTVMEGMLFDLERVEVLKGPQGTLYGRNATAGAINILPRRPSFDREGEASLEVGNYDAVSAQAAMNIPLSDRFAVRVAGLTSGHDGYFSDGTSDGDLQALRLSALFKPTDTLTINLMGDLTDQGGRGTGSTVKKRCNGEPCYLAGPWVGLADQSAAFAPIAPKSRRTFLDNHFRGLTGQVDWENGLGTLTFIGARRTADVHYYTHTTGILIDEDQNPRQTSLELRLAGRSGAPLQWVIGGYFLDTSMTSRSLSENGPGRSFGDQRTGTGGTAYAAFGQAAYALTDRFRVVGGLRYTTEQKYSKTQRYNVNNVVGPDPVIPLTPTGTLVYSVDEKKRWDATNWKAGIEWDVADRSLIYANASTGFKAGGFFSGPPGNDTYAPERLRAYVVGSKNRFLDNKLQLNAEAFYLDYRDQQISYTKIVGVASVSVTENAGRLTAKGVEVELDWLPLRHTRISGAGQYLDAKYDQLTYFTPAPPAAITQCLLTPGQPGGTTLVNCNGQRALQSPKWSFTADLEQTVPLASGASIIAAVGAQYETRRINHISYLPDTISDANTRWDASLSYAAKDDAYRITAFIRNAGDTVTPTYILPPPGYNQNGAIVAVLKPPRTYGVRLQAKF